jgi:hypothetical protein
MVASSEDLNEYGANPFTHHAYKPSADFELDAACATRVPEEPDTQAHRRRCA